MRGVPHLVALREPAERCLAPRQLELHTYRPELEVCHSCLLEANRLEPVFA